MNAQDALLQMPGQIRKMELDLWKHKQQLDVARMKAKLRAADVALKIAQATADDGTGKKVKVYKNQDERDSATSGHLESDAEHKALLRAVDEEAAVVVRIEAALGYLRDTQRNARVLLLARSPPELVFEPEDLGVALAGSAQA